MRWTEEMLAQLQKRPFVELLPARPNKYNAKPTVVDGIKFASKAEAKRYGELQLLWKADVISGLELQPRYELMVNGTFICEYVADFRYWNRETRKMVIEDVKGMRTPTFILKKKLMRAIHGIEVIEIS